MLIELVEIVFSGTRLPPFLPLLEVLTVPDRNVFLFLLCACVIEPHMTRNTRECLNWQNYSSKFIQGQEDSSQAIRSNFKIETRAAEKLNVIDL